MKGAGESMTIRSSLIAALVGVTLLLPTAHGAAAPDRKPDIFGVWLAIASNSTNFDPRWANKPYAPTPEFTAWGAEQSRQLGRLGVELPTPGACEPVNPAGFVGGFFPTQILQGHNQIVILNEWVAVPRRIYMDGRGHPAPEDTLPTWQSHSIGRWEGDTLVVDTRHMKAGIYDRSGAPHSQELHLTERIRRIEGNQIEFDITLDDPVMFTQPWKLKRLYRFSGYRTMEGSYCETNRNPVSENGQTAVLGSEIP